MPCVLPAVLVAAAAAFPAQAADWGQLATISSTLGVNANRLCVGEGLRSDIGCPSYAPSLTTAGDLSVTGNLSANTFIGDGSGLTGISSGDRIASGTTNVLTTQDRSVTITTAGSQRVLIGESGNVGIGTSAPSTTLHVNGVATVGGPASQGTINVNNTTGALRGAVYTDGTDIFLAGSGGSTGIQFRTAAANRMRIDSSGNVGIGTTTPSGSLHVLGNSTSYATAPLQITNTPPAQNPSTLFLTTGWSGNYGTDYGLIGISKTALIALNGLNPSVVLPYGAQASNPHGFSSASSGYAYYKPYVSSSSNDTLFDTMGDYRFLTEEAGAYQSRQVFRITSSGTVAVGLGPASAQTRSSGAWYPSSTLHVSGTARVTSWTAIAANVAPTTELDVYGTISATNILMNGAPLSTTADRITSGTTNIIATQDRSVTITTAGSQRVVIGESGNVGIGTAAPSKPLDIVGTSGYVSVKFKGQYNAVGVLTGDTNTVGLGLDNGSDGYANAYVAGSGNLRLRTNSAERIRIDSSGNVGIGTTSPAKTLDVSGTAQIVSRTLVGGTGTPSATLQVSGSLLLAGNDNIPCTASVLGLVRRNPTTGRMQVCR